jgi:hypothetical protein
VRVIRVDRLWTATTSGLPERTNAKVEIEIRRYGPLTDIVRRNAPTLVRRFGTEHVVRCQRTSNTFKRKLTHRLDRDRVFDRREDTRAD